MFQIPEDLSGYSASGLEDLRRIATDEWAALKSSIDVYTISEEDLERLTELQQFRQETVPNELAERADREARFAAATAEDPEETEEESVETTEPEVVTASTTSTVRVADIAGAVPQPQIPDGARARTSYSTLVASASVSTGSGEGYEQGQALTSMLDVAKVFEARSASHDAMNRRGMQSNGPISMPVAQLIRNYPDEYSVSGDSTDYAKLLAVADEKRLPGGSLIASTELDRKRLQEEHPERDSLVAAMGWCAPSETDYDICLQITTDGLADFPEVQARRGGIRHNTGIEFDTIFGSGTGFFDLTEAQVAAGTTKTCLEIPCPDFVDTRLGVTGLCLTGNILANRGYPEFTATFTRGALAASAHQINREQIADVVAGSTPITLTGTQPWTSDGSVVSQVLSAVGMAVMDIKYRLRLSRSATLEVIMPFWIGAQMRADWIRRNGGDYENTLSLTDSAIAAAFAVRGARVQYVYDWQDAFATGAVSGAPGVIGPGADVPLTELPTSLSFLIYPAGTWIRAVSDVITLNSVYDSTKLATNQVTHLFTETGWAMVKMCPLSRVYTINICPNGSTGVQRAVTC